MKTVKKLSFLFCLLILVSAMPEVVSAQWTNSPSTRLYTYDQVVIERSTPKYSWLELDVNGQIGTEGIDLYTESSTGTGWSQQITWNTPAGRRHIITDHQGTERLLIYPGYGGGANREVEVNGKLGVGTGTVCFPTSVGGTNISQYRLYVKGGILTDEVRVRTGWCDYVFYDNYYLTPLEEVEEHIETHGYLHKTPSAATVESDGIGLGDMTVKQQEKIEEIFLHMIDMNKRLKELEAENEVLKKELEALKK